MRVLPPAGAGALGLAGLLVACATVPARAPHLAVNPAEARDADVRRITYRLTAEGASGRARGSVLASVRRSPPGLSLEVVDPFGRLRGLLFADPEGLVAHVVAENLYVEGRPDAETFRAVFGLDLDLGGMIELLRPAGADGAPPPEVRVTTAKGKLVLVPRSSTWGGGLVRPPSPDSARRTDIQEAAHLLMP